MPTLAKKVFLSSTFIDLKDYREAAIHACLRVGLIPVYMEDFPPDPRDAVAFCKDKVDEADLFLGIYAHRYGYVPEDSEMSITEMEYDWAIERNLPVYLFIIDSGYPWLPDKIDKGKEFEKLDRFKQKISKKHILKKFRDVITFKEDVLLLSHDLARTEASLPAEKPALTRWSLPVPPEMHSVPPYIQTTRFIGRRRELDDLDAWARSSDTMLVVEAIGGVGKSALTWEWTRDRASKAISQLAGTLWWSFYESGASTASFVREALAYVTKVDPEDLQTVPQEEQARRLLAELRQRPYLFVLDGFERLLTAYQQLDPSKLQDDQVKSDHRASTNPWAEDLLRILPTCYPSKILLTTRLMPLPLENRAHKPVPGVRHLKLSGLDPVDGEDLLRSLAVDGESTTIRQFLRQFDNHSLLISVLAGRILDYRPAPGDFNRWLADPKEGGSLRLSELDLKQRRTHILAYAFNGLDPMEKLLLGRIAVLSDAADYVTLSILNPYLPPRPEEVQEPPVEPLKADSYLQILRRQAQVTQSNDKITSLHQEISYLSTTGVYEDLEGVVDDSTPLPESASAKYAAVLAAERAFRAVGAAVLRAPGIYGAGRGLHLRLARGELRLSGDGSRYSSRIHVEDLARLLLASARTPGETFVVGDLEPCRQIEMVSWLCDRLGLPLPASAPLSEVHETLRRNRRVDGARALARLGVVLEYPSYREGFVSSDREAAK